MSNSMRVSDLLDVIERLSPGPLHSTTGNQTAGKIPIISQSETGCVGFHDEAPGVEASVDHPIVTFANHTCAVRLHVTPFSTIQNVFPLRGKTGVLDTEYLHWFLKQAISPSFYGGHWPALVEKEIKYPAEIKEQRQIASRLKTQLAEVETARKAAQTQLQDSRLLRSRLLKQFFAALDAGPKKKLGDFAATTSGVTPSRDNEAYWQPAEIAWVKTGEVDFAPITAVREAISKKALAECSLSLLPAKSILIAITGEGKTRGRSAVLEIPATTNQHCFAILPNETWEPSFLQLWLRSSYQDLRELSEGRGGSRSALSGAQLNALEVPAPSKVEQQTLVLRIQAAMAEVDAIEASAKAALADIERLPSRVLAQAFNPQGDHHGH